MQLEGNTFLISGGASGLGAATARDFHAHGARVVIADLAADKGHALVEELGAGATFTALNVADEASAQAAVDHALATFGALHGLINCAGIGPACKVLGKEGPHPLDFFSRVVNVNLTGSFNMVRLTAEAMAKNAPNEEGERGVIINTASIAAFDGQIGQAAYAASKAGIVGMVLPLARELARYGIRVNAIAPGLFLTPMMEALPVEVQDALGKATPFPSRLGRPAEFALMARQMVENVMLNGETIRLDGAV
ncbi:MAG TPA: SDR family NAD(P)-dependent oxidoreductase, partial [Rhodocyclaceae bacterium]|nr:SDR family NAD(P)-dependent oxidoreductase [Rhodocyclaceae bacterium]